MPGWRRKATLAEFRVCAKSALMKRGRAEAIIDEVRTTVAKWTKFAEHARVPDDAHPESSATSVWICRSNRNTRQNEAMMLILLDDGDATVNMASRSR